MNFSIEFAYDYDSDALSLKTQIFMKTLTVLLLSMFSLSFAMGQLKVTAKCDDFNVNVLNGTVNGLKPSATVNEIKNKLPCFTSFEDESQTAKCGGGVYFKDKDLSFYTDRDYIEIGPKFKGKLSIPLMGAIRGTFFNNFGNPKLKDDTWDAFQTSYGIIILHYDKTSKVNLIQMSTQSTENIKLCE
jgi:hypothetical protein